MNYSVVIPAYNEANFLVQTLDSIINQTVLPKQVVVVNDNSTDNTGEIAQGYANKFDWISVVHTQANSVHLPGSKVIRAFEKGLEKIQPDYDIIVKLDADLILPDNYFSTIISAFEQNPKLGMAGGFAYIEKNGDWVLESLTDKDHIRGALKAYRKSTFEQIGGLKPAMGWDTVDELLCRYFGWEIQTFEDLKVKHLKPTGARYDQSARYKQGEAFHRLGYGFLITAIASVKLASKKGKPLLTFDYIVGFLKASFSNQPKLVTPDQEKFIRNFRWSRMKKKLKQ